MGTHEAISPGWLLTLYCALILGASLVGGWLPMWLKLTHTRLQIATSAVAGLMLGVGLLHMFAHAAEQLSVHRAVAWMLCGFLVMFFVQRFFHFHHHDVPEGDPTQCCDSDADDPAGSARHEHEHSQEHHEHCAGHDHHGHPHTLADKSARQLSWIGAGLGLVLHTIINGFALAASVQAESHLGTQRALAGAGTFLVIFLHKPFDAMVITTLMTKGGWSRGARHLANACFALVIPLGVALFHLGASNYAGSGTLFGGGALAFAAGTFLCIACSDLLPELQFHSHDRLKLSAAMLAGLGLAVLIGGIEASGHPHGPDEDDHEHDHVPSVEAPALPGHTP